MLIRLIPLANTIEFPEKVENIDPNYKGSYFDRSIIYKLDSISHHMNDALYLKELNPSIEEKVKYKLDSISHTIDSLSASHYQASFFQILSSSHIPRSDVKWYKVWYNEPNEYCISVKNELMNRYKIIVFMLLSRFQDKKLFELTSYETKLVYYGDIERDLFKINNPYLYKVSEMSFYIFLTTLLILVSMKLVMIIAQFSRTIVGSKTS